eukprot:CAMPEP_0172780996 /NCGR_PEP_ID=MMETSP1074-20121228/203207_1 /TAXON_ID=2916 /ORGANISM="Ceratium fusus, Strain PA161109" /LENGTH=438 /DNA_ID=CAMNT_0013617973 /DNA_START=118 /DNA_END=1430 /DNA_ORIENTATION=+
MAAVFLAALLLRSPFSFTALRSSARAKPHGLTTMRLGPGGGSDPVNNVSPEMQAEGMKWAQKYEDVLLSGTSLWSMIKKNEKEPRKIYFIGTNGNGGKEIAESVMDCLAYIPAPDGTFFLHRKPGVGNPKLQYGMVDTDASLGEKSTISPVDLFMDDEDKYRELEYEIVKDFDSEEYKGFPMACVLGEGALLKEETRELVQKGIVVWLDVDPEHSWAKTQFRTRAGKEFDAEEYKGFPMGCVLGEGALLKEKTRELVQKGIVVWLDVDPQYSWAKTQFRSKAGGGIYLPKAGEVRPPVWAIANGWDGDVDDTEGKLEYIEIVEERRKLYETLSDIRLRTDTPGIVENSYWGAGKIVKAMKEYLGYADAGDGSVEDEILETDLEKFLEGARLSKYFKQAMAWCEEQGAASIEDIVENCDDFAEAMALKPLEKKRLVKAA